jgi:hypothetical protein
MDARSDTSVRLKQLKVWTLMVATLVVGLLLAFGRWAGLYRTQMEFSYAAWGAVPAWWVLAIDYGVLLTMVAVLIQADRVEKLFSSTETLTWLGGICLFTAGLYHDRYGHRGPTIWGTSANGYGTFTEFLRKPSMANLPLLLSVWPMAYSLIVVPTSFVALMDWRWRFLRWQWIMHALFLVALTSSWIVFVLWPWNVRYESSWLAGSLFVLPALLITLALVRDFDRKIYWMNLIAAVWLLTALSPRFGGTGRGPVVMSVKEALRWIDHGYLVLLLADLLILGGSIGALFSRGDSDSRH